MMMVQDNDRCCNTVVMLLNVDDLRVLGFESCS